MEVVGQFTGGGDPVRSGCRTAQQRVLAVVRGHDRRQPPRLQQRGGSIGTPCRSEDAVAVDHDRNHGVGDQGAEPRRRSLPHDPVPGRRPGHPNRSRSSSTSTANPAAGMGRWMISLRASGSTPGARQRHQPGARSCRGRSAESWPAPSMPTLPATTRTAPFHLWASAARCGHQSATSAASTRYWSALVDVEADVDHDDVTRQPTPGTEDEPGLERLERDGAIGGQHAVARPAPVNASTPLGMSTASTSGRAPECRRVRARSTRPGTRCRRQRRSPGRTAEESAGASGRRSPEPSRRVVRRYVAAVRPSAPLFPAPAMTLTDAAVGAAEHRAAPGPRRRPPARSINSSTGSGAAHRRRPSPAV